MKSTYLKRFFTLNILLVLLLSLFGAGYVQASPQVKHSSISDHHHAVTYSGSDCNQQCSNNLGVSASLQKEKRQDNTQPRPSTISIPFYASFQILPEFNDKRQSVNIDSRIIRPPDKLTLNCILRV
jgi:hypothetical protein